MSSSSARVKIFPVGLFGVLMTIARVLGPNARRSSSASNVQSPSPASGGRSRTNLGVAILRYEQANALLKDKRLIQGSIRWPAHFGITSGLLAGWWKDMLLSQEGEDHARLRRLANPAFSPRILEALTPDFTALAKVAYVPFVLSGTTLYLAGQLPLWKKFPYHRYGWKLHSKE